MKNQFLSFSNLLVLVLAALWIIFTSIQTSQRSIEVTYQPRAGFSAPPFELEGLDGNQYSLKDMEGMPVIVNIWASWCTPCKAEMPALESMQQRFGDRIAVLAVNNTQVDTVADVKLFVQREALTFPILLDLSGEVSDRYQVQALPSTFFINKFGIIEEVVIGGPMSAALLEIRIQQLLGEK